jgi:predicted dithiol-disulfide oxidoreductase (DUF899 family)
MQHAVVSQNEWLAARKALLAKEKEFTRARDQLSEARRALPWVNVEKNYVFEGPNGRETLSDLFGGKSQLIIYHFMLGPGWVQGCPSCSFLADHFDGAAIHLAQRDVSLVVVSRAPFAEIEAYKKRMGWKFKWVSSYGNDFNHDFHVSFTPEEKARGKVEYNYAMTEFPSEEAGSECVHQNRQRPGPAHLLFIRARPRHSCRRLQLPRFCTEGPRRRRVAMEHGMGAPPR